MAIAVLVLLLAAPSESRIYAKDVKFALSALEEECKHLIKSKGINWSRVRSQFTKEARKVKSDADHWVLLSRLVVRLRDGHARVNTTAVTMARRSS